MQNIKSQNIFLSSKTWLSTWLFNFQIYSAFSILFTSFKRKKIDKKINTNIYINTSSTLESWERMNKIQPVLLECNRQILPAVTFQPSPPELRGFISPSRLDLYLFYQALMNLCALWLHPQDKHLKGSLPLLFAQSCSSEDSQAISPGRDKHAIQSCRRQTVRLSRRMFFCISALFILPLSPRSHRLTWRERASGFCQRGVIDVRGKKSRQGFFIFFFTVILKHAQSAKMPAWSEDQPSSQLQSYTLQRTIGKCITSYKKHCLFLEVFEVYSSKGEAAGYSHSESHTWGSNINVGNSYYAQQPHTTQAKEETQLWKSWTWGHVTLNSVSDEKCPVSHQIQSDTPKAHTYAHKHTLATAAAEVQQWEIASYFSVVRLCCRLQVFAGVVRWSLAAAAAAVVRLPAITFAPVIGPRPRRTQSEGLGLRHAASLGLHPLLQRLETGGQRRKLRRERKTQDVCRFRVVIFKIIMIIIWNIRYSQII